MAQEKDLTPYLNCLKTQQTSAKDYILNLFQDYDIVILCERDHREITQYDLYLDVISDKRFTDDVDQVYFEIGNALYNDTLNYFLHNSSLNSKEISAKTLFMQRNLWGGGASLWEKGNYSYYLTQIHKINTTLPEEKKVNVFGLDLGLNWETATENDFRQVKTMYDVGNTRDSIMAANFFRLYEQSKTKKALVVLNLRHAFLTDLVRVNTGRFIADKYKEKVTNVLISNLAMKYIQSDRDVAVTAIQQGKWDASFIKAKKNNIGFDFSGTPFGNDSVDLYPISLNRTYSDVFKGFVYYNYFPDLRTVRNVENFVDDEFAPELIRRYRLVQKVTNADIPSIDALKSKYNKVVNESYREEMPEVIEIIEQWLK
jgi:hypothetical protein